MEWRNNTFQSVLSHCTDLILQRELLVEKHVQDFGAALMITGLPEEGYNHWDIQRLVKNCGILDHLYSCSYLVVVLPLQRRAFLRFPDTASCCAFLKTRVRLKGICKLHFHIVRNLDLGSSEWELYKTFTNSKFVHVAKVERLLVVTLNGSVNLDVIKKIIQMVTIVGPVNGCLPLANRIVFEMRTHKALNDVQSAFQRFPLIPLQLKPKLGRLVNSNDVTSCVGLFRSASSYMSRVYRSEKRRKLTMNKQQGKWATNTGATMGPGAPVSSTKPMGTGASPVPVPADANPTTVVLTDQPKTEVTAAPAASTASTGAMASPVPAQADAKGADVVLNDPPIVGAPCVPGSPVSSTASTDAILSPGRAQADAGKLPELPPMNDDIFRLLTAALRERRQTRERQGTETSLPSATLHEERSDSSSGRARSSHGPSSSEEGFRSPPSPPHSSRRAHGSHSSSSRRSRRDRSPPSKRRRREEEEEEKDTRRETNLVILKGVPRCLTSDDVKDALRPFGETQYVIMIRKTLEATVCFVAEESARAVEKCKQLKIKGCPVTVFTEKGGHSTADQSFIPEDFGEFVTVDEIGFVEDESSFCLSESEGLVEETSTSVSSTKPNESSQNSRSIFSIAPETQDPSITTPSTTTHSSPSSSSTLAKSSTSSPSAETLSSHIAHKSPQRKTPKAAIKSAASVKEVKPSLPRRSTRSSTHVKTEATKVKDTAEPLSAPVTEGVVAMPDHTVSAETPAGKGAVSETNRETSSEAHPSPHREGEGERSQAKNDSARLEKENQSSALSSAKPGIDKEHPRTETNESSEEGKDQGDEKPESEKENVQIIDSVEDQADGVNGHLGDGSGAPECQQPETEDPSYHEGPYQVLDSVTEEDETEGTSQIDMKDSFQVLDSIEEDLTAMDALVSHADQTVGEGGETEMPLPDEDLYRIIDSCDDKPSDVDGEQSAQDNELNQDSQMLKDRLLQDKDSAEVQALRARDPENKDVDVLKPEPLQVLDSVHDQISTEAAVQKPETQLLDTSQTEEEEDTFQVIDFVDNYSDPEDSEKTNKGRQTRTPHRTAAKEDKAPKKTGATVASRNERKGKTSERLSQRGYTPLKKGDTKELSREEEDTYDIVDSFEEEPSRDYRTPEQSGRAKDHRISARNSRTAEKDDKRTKGKTIAEMTAEDEGEEASYQIIDSTEDELISSDPSLTMGQKEGLTEEENKKDDKPSVKNSDASVASDSQEGPEVKEEEEPTYQIVDSFEHEQNKDVSHVSGRAKRVSRMTREDKNDNAKVSRNEDKSPKKSEVSARQSQRRRSERTVKTEDKITKMDVSDSVENKGLADDITATEGTATEQQPRRGTRTTKPDHTKMNKKDDVPSSVREPEEGGGENLEEEREDVYHVVDSVGDEALVDDVTATEQPPSRDKTARTGKKDAKRSQKDDAPSKKNNTPVRESEEKVRGQSKRGEEQGATYQVVDSVEDETVPDNIITAEETEQRPRRARTSKKDDTKFTKKDDMPSKMKSDAPVREPEGRGEKEELEQEDTYQVVDSVEDETVPNNITTTEETATEQRPRRGARTSKKDDTKTTKKDDMSSKMKSDAPVIEPQGRGEKEEEQEDTYQVVDSVEDETVPDNITTTEETATERRPRRGARTSMKDNTKTTKKVDMSSKMKSDAPVREPEGRGEKEELEQEDTYEVVDSVEDETVPDNITVTEEPATEQRPRRGARTSVKDTKITKKDVMPSKMKTSDAPVREPEGRGEKEEEQQDTYHVVDSLEDEALDDDDVTATVQRPRRGRMAGSSKKADKMSEKDEAPTKKNDAPVGESEEKVGGECEREGEQEATYEVVDSVTDETLPDNVIAAEETAAEPRTRRGTRTSKKDDKKSQKDDTPAPAKKNDTPAVESEEKVGREREREEEQGATYQVVDSVEDETPPEESLVLRPRRGARARARRTEKKDPAKSTEKNDTPPKKSDSGELEEKKGGDEREKETDEDTGRGKGDMTVSTGADTGSSKKQMKETTEEDEEEEEGVEARSADLDSLDEVSDEEENYPDDTTEEEELIRQQAMWKQLERSEREKEREREQRRSKDREERETDRRCSSRSSTRSRGAGGGDGERKRGREREEEEEEEEEMGLVTLDEVGADEPGEGDEGEERKGDGENEAGEMTEEELQALVTVDEIGDEEEEQKCSEAEPSPMEPCPSDRKEESEDAVNPQVPVALCGDEQDRDEDQTNIPSSAAAELKNDDVDDPDEQMNFVTLDEVGEENDEEEEEEVMTRRGVRTKRRSRQSVVKGRRTRSIAKQEESTAVELAPPTSTDASSPLVQVQDPQPRRGTRTRASKKDETAEKDATPQEKGNCRKLVEEDGGEEREKEAEDNGCAKGGDTPTVFTDADTESSKELTKEQKTTEEEDEEQCQARARVSLDEVSDEEEDYEDENNDEPQVEKHRSQSPTAAADFKLPPFTPNNPIGLEFVVPKTGFFCNLCCAFYENENAAKDLHCSTHEHYKNMEKHYQKLQERPGNSAPGSASD